MTPIHVPWFPDEPSVGTYTIAVHSLTSLNRPFTMVYLSDNDHEYIELTIAALPSVIAALTTAYEHARGAP